MSLRNPRKRGRVRGRVLIAQEHQDFTLIGYEHCQKPLEVKSGHRRKEYCNDTCRQAAHRLRVEQEHTTKRTNLEYYLTTYHSPRLRSILERMLKEQGVSDLLRLVVAIDEECGHAQASDEMQARVAYLVTLQRVGSNLH